MSPTPNLPNSNTSKNTAIILAALLNIGIQNAATASVKPPTSANETVNQPILQQPNFIAQQRLVNSVGGCSVIIPKEVTTNEVDRLLAYSPTTRTSYLVTFKDFPIAGQLNLVEKRQMLAIALKEGLGLSGVIVRSTDYEIDGHPGLDILMRHGDGTRGQYRAFVVNQRVFFLGAVTTDQFTQESSDFFASFRIHPDTIRSTSEIY
ncbi:hypothetical protein [Nostoc sp. CMAA1605]|uniref:hypothetical protein n=1 Tax=Nostoc sp. CMAA1605 TaxID=2055159 RepID=UPI001F375827|nr:hypothetical protein [Nostoc sp. CMAA1605]MCF4967129.1 hypothetical protein [Nostoc sp. CMAA1605]